MNEQACVYKVHTHVQAQKWKTVTEIIRPVITLLLHVLSHWV